MMPLMKEEEISRKVEHCDDNPRMMMLRKEEAISMQIEHCDDNASRMMMMKGRRCDGAPITWMMMMGEEITRIFCLHPHLQI
jgi:hypothetical protein